MTNPLSDLLLSDEQYKIVEPFLNNIAVRDYIIRKKYKQLRFNKISSGDAIDKIREEYPMLQWDTLKKIATTVSRKFN